MTSRRRETSLTERTNLQFRAEFCNIANHPNFRNPEARVFTTGGGLRPEVGRIAGTVTKSRQVPLALKLVF